VILALTKSAVQRILHPSGPAFAAEPEIHGLLDSAFGFPMVKMFVVVKNRWWEEANRANLYATRVPTRELHYWKGHTLDSKQGMIMLYTDRPASSFWSNYVAPGEQTDFAGMPPGHALAPPLRDRLIKKVVRYLRDNGVPDITAEDVVWYGIRDWGREPFGGGNHAWRPERRYWVVMRRLAEIADHPGRTPSLHVCGEAYSDYHGFMEGSLRSGAYVLHRILHRDGTNPILGWLADAGLMVRPDYLASLRNWATSLDGIPPTEPFL
jgi:hypothetical protein